MENTEKIEREIDYTLYCSICCNDFEKSYSDFLEKDLSEIKNRAEKRIYSEIPSIDTEQFDLKISGYIDSNYSIDGKEKDLSAKEFKRLFETSDVKRKNDLIMSLNINIKGTETVEYFEDSDVDGNNFLHIKNDSFNTEEKIEIAINNSINEFESADGNKTYDFWVNDYDDNSETVKDSIYLESENSNDYCWDDI